MEWKTIAIIFMTLFIMETLFFGASYWIVGQEDKAINNCYYNTCGEYADADYVDGVCACYDYDNLGQLIIFKTTYDG